MLTNDSKKVSIVLMVLLLFSTQACTDIFLPGLPTIAKEFGQTMGVTNLTISVYNYSQAFFVLFIGVVSDLRGRRSTLLFCLLLHIVASVWIALCSSISVMIAMRFIQALGSAAIYIVLRLIIKDTMDKKAQIHATGLLVVGLVLSPILAPVLGAWIIRLSNWRYCFWAIALLEIPLFIWAWNVIRETNHQQLALRASFTLKRHIIGYFRVLQDGYFLSLALIVGATFGAFYAFISISSYLYIDQYGIKDTSYAYVFIGVAIAYLIGNRLMSQFNKNNLRPDKIIQIGICTSIVGTALILTVVFAQTISAKVACLTLGTCLLRLATALINPPAQVAVTNHFQENSSHALGLLTCIQYSFAAAGTMVVSELAFQPSTNYMISTSIFVVLSFIGYSLVPRRRNPIPLS